MTRRWALRLVIGVPSVLALGFVSVRFSIAADLVFDGAWTLTRFAVDAARAAN